MNQRLRVEDVDSPLVNVRPVKSVLLVIVTGDRGLCGGYNNFVLKKARPSAVPTVSNKRPPFQIAACMDVHASPCVLIFLGPNNKPACMGKPA